jgi:glycosyltransferase involved in cell wall biosynthesis
MPIEPERVTVAVEGWNAEDLESRALFQRSIESLRRQTYPIDRCEVCILVDSGDVAGQSARVAEMLPRSRVLGVNDETYYRAKNAAMRAAHGEFLVFADSDVAYEPEWLASLLACFRPGIDLVVGNTQFVPGFLSRTLNLTDWPGSRPRSGYTDWFYGNNLAMRRSLFEDLQFREDLGRSGGGSVNLIRMELQDKGVRFWFCAEAKGWHHLAPFFEKRIRVGAFLVRYRKLAPNARWSWVIRVPLVGALLPAAGSMLLAWRRAWKMRTTLPGKGLSLPYYLASIALVKAVEGMGSALYAWVPSFVDRRFDWFDVPVASSAEPAGIGEPGSSSR